MNGARGQRRVNGESGCSGGSSAWGWWSVPEGCKKGGEGEGEGKKGRARTAGRKGLVPFMAREVTSRGHLPISAGGCTAQSPGVPFHAGRGDTRGAALSRGGRGQQPTHEGTEKKPVLPKRDLRD